MSPLFLAAMVEKSPAVFLGFMAVFLGFCVWALLTRGE